MVTLKYFCNYGLVIPYFKDILIFYPICYISNDLALLDNKLVCNEIEVSHL